MPGGVAPKFGSAKVSRYTGVSQLQLRVSRYTVQLRLSRRQSTIAAFFAFLFCAFLFVKRGLIDTMAPQSRGSAPLGVFNEAAEKSDLRVDTGGGEVGTHNCSPFRSSGPIAVEGGSIADIVEIV